jgi:hypothetical protein
MSICITTSLGAECLLQLSKGEQHVCFFQEEENASYSTYNFGEILEIEKHHGSRKDRTQMLNYLKPLNI